MSPLSRILASLPLLSLCWACTSVELEALHSPTLGAEGTVDAEEQTIELSTGTALAIECNVVPTYEPCAGMEVMVHDVELASSRSLFLDNLFLRYDGTGASPRSGFVVIGHAVGETELVVRTDDADATYQIRIVE